MGERRYNVNFREVALITETVIASSAREAVQRVRDGDGERVSMSIDETRKPTSFRAFRDPEPNDSESK